jgi:hypothetical protein
LTTDGQQQRQERKDLPCLLLENERPGRHRRPPHLSFPDDEEGRRCIELRLGQSQVEMVVVEAPQAHIWHRQAAVPEDEGQGAEDLVDEGQLSRFGKNAQPSFGLGRWRRGQRDRLPGRSPTPLSLSPSGQRSNGRRRE